MAGGLSAADGHAAAGVPVKGFVLYELLKHLFCGLSFAEYFNGTGGAGLRAAAATVAYVSIEENLSLLNGEGVLGTDRYTSHTPIAARIRKAELFFKPLPFRVAAPLTSQGTSLQKNRSTDPRSVYKRTMDKIENDAAVLLAHNRFPSKECKNA